MSFKYFRTIFLIVLFFVVNLAGCIENPSNSTNIENYLNSLIGRKYDTVNGWQGWNKIYEDEFLLEIEKVLSRGCSYAIKVDKEEGVVRSWRFTSLKSKCSNSYRPSV